MPKPGKKRQVKVRGNMPAKKEVSFEPIPALKRKQATEEEKRKDDEIEREEMKEEEKTVVEKAEEVADEDMPAEDELEYEDEYEDEIEEIPEMPVKEGEEEEEEEEEDLDMSEMKEALPEPVVWDPRTRPLEDGEELVCDESAYDMLHTMTSDWPCLSFDIVRDSLGNARKRFPHTMYLVTGSQADVAKRNKLTVMKIAHLRKTKHDKNMDADSDDDDDDISSSDEENSDDDMDPTLETQEIKHEGGVNRLRVDPLSSHIVATWADTGKVHVWDIRPQLATLDSPGAAKLGAATAASNTKPLQSMKHRTEGFAIDWGCHTGSAHNLLTGDLNGSIYVWRTRGEGSGWAAEGPFKGHTNSVEDLQWSPFEASIFASCASDGTMRVWDARDKAAGAVRMCRAHNCDVNVISWNRRTSFLLASGGDDGSFRVWDLRHLSDNAPISDFHYHSKPITSVEWCPDDESTLAVASADDSISIWDFSLEEDVEAKPQEGSAKVEGDVPPQLMFVHMGQTEIKELHWHPQIPNALISTALDGFNIFKPANL